METGYQLHPSGMANLSSHRFAVHPRKTRTDGQDTHVILFWCSVSRVVLRSSVVALLSMFRKRSIAEILRWMLCFGMSNLETKVSKPRSSQLKSIGQQSWPCNQTSWKHELMFLSQGREGLLPSKGWAETGHAVGHRLERTLHWLLKKINSHLVCWVTAPLCPVR